VVTFVDCAHDSLTPAEQGICPTPAQKARGDSWLIWSPSSPYNRLTGTLRYKTDLALAFGIRVIEHQPGAYLSAVGHDLASEFSPDRHSYVADTYQYNALDSYPALPGEAQDVANLYQGSGNGQPHPVRGIAQLFRSYQKWVHVPGIAFLGGFVACAAGLALRRRKRLRNSAVAPAVCFGLTALILAIMPDLVASFDYRYLVPVLPPLCVAVALSVSGPQPYRQKKDPVT
jgi:hypothetical protein